MAASSLISIINYSISGNFAFDAALLEFTGVPTRVKLKDLRPAGTSSFASYAAAFGFDLNWGDGTLTGTPTGAPPAPAGTLDLRGATVKYVDYDATANANSTQVGCIRMKWIPDYTGNPPATEDRQTLFFVGKLPGENQITLDHVKVSGASSMQIVLRNSANGLELDGDFGDFVAVAGQTYEFELNWDITAGAIRLFIDGVQFGPTFTNTYTRDSSSDLLRLGNDATGALPTVFQIEDFRYFTTVQHTANYTAPSALPTETQFSVAEPVVTQNSTVLVDALESFVETTSVVVGNDEIKYILVFKGQDKFFNGSAWVNSDGTYAEANTPEDVNINASALNLSLGGSFKVKALLHSDVKGITTPELEVVTFGFNFFNILAEIPTSTVFGFYKDAGGNGVEGATVTFELSRRSKQYREAGNAIIEKPVVVTTNALGRFEADLIRTSAFEIDGGYTIRIVKDADDLNTSKIDTGKIAFTVPDLPDVNITDLITSVL